MKTLQERYAAALEAIGERRVKGTFKYSKYTRFEGGFYYLGRAGALRIGHTIRGSIPVTEKFKQKLLAGNDGKMSGVIATTPVSSD